MCTAISFTNGDSYFGRNLDLDYSYNTSVLVTPRDMEIRFTNGDSATRHYAVMGSGIVENNYPLYFDAVNEKGLCCAALRFTSGEYARGTGENFVASFEFILWVLSQNGSVAAAKDKIKKIQISSRPFSHNLPPTPLHFLISDKSGSLTVEQTASGIKVYENAVGVLTNNPEFPMQMTFLNNFAHLQSAPQQGSLSKSVHFEAYSNGLGAYGLPGDFSSASRFARAVFVKENSVCEEGEEASAAHLFSILGNVAVPSGSVITREGKIHKTIYSACCNATKGIYYYKPGNSLSIKTVKLWDYNLDSKNLILA